MYIVESYFTAVVFCIITMLCWGSWSNTQKLAGKSWRFELYYWDYVWGILIFAILLAFTAGSFGDKGRSFTDDLTQAGSGSLISSFTGGVIFNLSNILLVAAIALARDGGCLPHWCGHSPGPWSNYKLSRCACRQCSYFIFRSRADYSCHYHGCTGIQEDEQRAEKSVQQRNFPVSSCGNINVNVLQICCEFHGC